MNERKLTAISKTTLLALTPLVLALAWWTTRPFAVELSSSTDPLSDLSPAQRSNIRLAASRIDRCVIKPSQVFSFNGIVGPRSLQRGYRPAPSYLEADSPSTAGGGICLLSSSLYRAALHAGLTVVERKPHTRTVRTIAPGLDATVWYGQADLKLRNPYPYPVEIVAGTSPRALEVKILGSALPRMRLSRTVSRANAQDIVVSVFRAEGGSQPSLVSRDLYRLSR